MTELSRAQRRLKRAQTFLAVVNADAKTHRVTPDSEEVDLLAHLIEFSEGKLNEAKAQHDAAKDTMSNASGQKLGATTRVSHARKTLAMLDAGYKLSVTHVDTASMTAAETAALRAAETEEARLIADAELLARSEAIKLARLRRMTEAEERRAVRNAEIRARIEARRTAERGRATLFSHVRTVRPTYGVVEKAMVDAEGMTVGTKTVVVPYY